LVVVTQHTKRISIDDLVVGMYIVELDQPWLQSPFLFHRRRIRRHEEITRLKAYGIRQVTIDLTRGLELVETVETLPRPAEMLLPCPPALSSHPLSESQGKAPSPQEGDTLSRPRVSPLPDPAVVRAVYTEAMTTVRSIFDGAKTGAPLNSGAAEEIVHSLMETVLSHHAALVSLIHIRQFEANLYAHSINTCVFALMLGTMQGLDKAALTSLGMGALLHDVGQIHLPRNLLCKPGLYTAQEQQLMQAHPHLGATMLSQAPMPGDTCRVVAEHHERVDGSGYPQGLSGAALSPLSQIVTIAEIYDTMLDTREGRPPLLPAQAIKELYQLGRSQQLDLGLVECMIRCLGIYPVGSLVELSTGERGLVVAVNPGNALRPVVHILWDPRQQPYTTPVTVDLAAPNAEAPSRMICHVLDPTTAGHDLAAYIQEGHGA
jgi:HD-GYP domain-containing protein (c-di-GMP phosphodiesterase class II)